MRPMLVRKTTVALFLLAFFGQIWTLRFGPLSVAMLCFVGASLISLNFHKIPLIAYTIFLAFMISIAFVWPEPYSSAFHYSKLLPIVSIFLQLMLLNVCISLDHNRPPLNASIVLFVAILFCLISAVLLTPSNFFFPGDGPLAFFNEKGLFGQYLTLLAVLMIVYRPSLGISVIGVGVIVYVLFIVEAGRAVLVLLSFLLVFLDSSRNKAKVFTAIFILSGFGFVATSSFGSTILFKLSILFSGEGVIGRYAAMAMILNASISDLLTGHGYGTYLNYRAFSIPLPGGAEYDYPGSLLLQLIFEIGVFGTSFIILLLTKLTFGRVSLLLIASVVSIVFIGGTHDVLMMISIVFMKLAHQRILSRQFHNKTNAGDLS